MAWTKSEAKLPATKLRNGENLENCLSQNSPPNESKSSMVRLTGQPQDLSISGLSVNRRLSHWPQVLNLMIQPGQNAAAHVAFSNLRNELPEEA
jgi:hypothetical protein